jgi:carbon-monoxide dehydrogenase medium subunit
VANTLTILQPDSIEDATRRLRELGEDARVVAGATAVTLMLRQGLIAPRVLISLGALEALRTLRMDGGDLHIGALVTHREMERNALVRQKWPVLQEAFACVANVRIRNAATVGGVLAEADYASDPPAVFVALDAEIEVSGANGRRMIGAGEFFRGFYETALAQDEIITGVRVAQLPGRTAGVYEKYRSRSSEDRPCVGVATIVQLAEDGQTCTELRVVVGAASERPTRLPHAEDIAHGVRLTEDVARAIADTYAAEVDTLGDLRGSEWYRTEMVRVWVRRAILHAAERARAA